MHSGCTLYLTYNKKYKVKVYMARSQFPVKQTMEDVRAKAETFETETA